MRVAVMSILIVLISISVYAQDFFPNSEIKDLWVLQIDKEAGTAVVRDSNGNEAVVTIDDKIGAEEKVVIKIDAASISVHSGNTTTKMPVIAGQVFSQDASSDKPLLPFYPE